MRPNRCFWCGLKFLTLTTSVLVLLSSSSSCYGSIFNEQQQNRNNNTQNIATSVLQALQLADFSHLGTSPTEGVDERLLLMKQQLIDALGAAGGQQNETTFNATQLLTALARMFVPQQELAAASASTRIKNTLPFKRTAKSGYGEPMFYAQPIHIYEKGDDLIHTLLPTILGQQLKEAANLVGTSGLVFDNLLLDKVRKNRDDPLKHLIPIIFGLLMMFFSKLPTAG